MRNIEKKKKNEEDYSWRREVGIRLQEESEQTSERMNGKVRIKMGCEDEKVRGSKTKVTRQGQGDKTRTRKGVRGIIPPLGGLVVPAYQKKVEEGANGCPSLMSRSGDRKSTWRAWECRYHTVAMF